MGFWVCSSNQAGERIGGAEEQLRPAPSGVEYPRDPAGQVLETSSGRLIKQQPAIDPRRRAWVWQFLPKGDRFQQYEQLYRRLEPLVSRTRREQGLSPYVYIKDDSTDGLGTWSYVSGTATSVSGNTLVDSTKNLPPDLYRYGVLEIAGGTGIGQRRSITTHTATTFTVNDAWTTMPAGAQYTVAARVNTWLRVRVLSVAATKAGSGTLRNEQVRLEFCIEDDAFNDWG